MQSDTIRCSDFLNSNSNSKNELKYVRCKYKCTGDNHIITSYTVRDFNAVTAWRNKLRQN